MFDRYMICEEGFRNVVGNGRREGFQFDVRITYYRGIVLSMIEGFEVAVDGEEFSRDAIAFTVRDQTYTLDELERDAETRWEFGERATLTVAKPGGLMPGKHTIVTAQQLRISYMPAPLRGTDKKTLTLS